MRIVHIAPIAPYNEGWSYQENLLPAYQMKLGHDVILVVTNQEHDGGKIKIVPCSDFISKDGFRVIRREQHRPKIPHIGLELAWIDVRDLLSSLHPDFIFFHGVGNRTIKQVTEYVDKENSKCVVVQDNHADDNIGYNSRSFHGRLLNLFHTWIYRRSDHVTAKVYGVTPWRRDYAERICGVPHKKTDVLIMGADDEKIKFDKKEFFRKRIRRENQIGDNEFLIVTGGRIDERKKIHLLMNAVNQLENVKLIVFGNVLDDICSQFEEELSDKVIWIGFIQADLSYQYFLAADMVFFPGQHSVLWEQACACKIPCIFGRWQGMEHVNNGGNADFIDDVTVAGIKKTIEDMRFTEKFNTMKKIAESSNTDVYLYSNIAKKSLECMRR